MPGTEDKTPYHAYLIRCADGTYYAGVCTDLARRLAEHNGERSGGARYTQARRPVRLAYSEACAGRAAAQRREYALRRLSHAEKAALAGGAKSEKLKVEGLG